MPIVKKIILEKFSIYKIQKNSSSFNKNFKMKLKALKTNYKKNLML